MIVLFVLDCETMEVCMSDLTPQELAEVKAMTAEYQEEADDDD